MMSSGIAERSEGGVAARNIDDGEQPPRYTRDAIYLSPADIQHLFGIPPGTLRRWVHEGVIRRVRRDVYDMAEIMEHLHREGKPPNAHGPKGSLDLTS